MSRHRPQSRVTAAPAGRGLARDEHSLDPGDWRAYRELAHKTLDTALDFIERARERPVWQPIPDGVKSELCAPLPIGPAAAEEIVSDVERLIMPYTCGNWHPRFFGWVHGTGTAGGVLSEMLAAAMNANVGGRDHSAVYVERQVIDWCRQIFSLPEGAGGLVVSGTSMATLIALTVARNHASASLTTSAPADVRRSGLRSVGPRLVAYTSQEAHGSVAKAMELLGLGRDSLRAVPVSQDFRLETPALARLIEADLANGHVPFAVIATAGTVNTGAIDPIAEVADLCARYGIWMHVDGAFGSLAILSDEMKPRLAGIERADSIAFDFHKWLHVPYDAGCVLVRNGQLQLEAFSQRPAYLAREERGLAAGDPWFCEMGPELSRGFRALKVWFALREHGLAGLGRQIEKNCAQARYLSGRIAETPNLELLAPVSLNIVCFRAVLPGLDAEALDRLNAGIVVGLQEQGIAAPSTTRIGGKLAIRVNITNHRTRYEDLDVLLDAVREAALDRQHELVAKVQAVRALPVSALQRPAGPGPQPSPSLARLEELLTTVLKRPEIAPLAGRVAIAFSATLDMPFAVERDGRLVMRPDCFANEDAGAVLVRHALELRLWLASKSKELSPEWSAAIAVMGARAGASYLSLLPRSRREAAIKALPELLRSAYERVGGAGHGGMRELMQPGSSLLPALVPMQVPSAVHVQVIVSSTAVRVEASNILMRLGELASPSETLLVTGADSRVTPLPETGRNGYSASPRPEPADIAFSSSTASSVSPAAFEAVEKLRAKLVHKATAGKFATAFAREMSAVRSRIAGFTGVRTLPGSEIILTASGTETELAALHFALAGASRSAKAPLVSIVIDPNETGSGVPLAAAGRYFLGQTSLGATVETGAQVPGFASGSVEVHHIGMRAACGSLRPLEEIDRDVARIVETAHDAGQRVLLHVLDASKTGAGAPSLEGVLALCQRHPGMVDVIVDACQMRLAPAAIRAYVAHGFMVQITGSKFFTGPPFSGALLLPEAIARRRARPVPGGLLDYSGEHEWPGPLARTHGLKPRRRNLGLLMRWTAALAEIDAYRRVPEASALSLLDRFKATAEAMIAGRSDMQLAEARPYDRAALAAGDAWSQLTTILPFSLYTGEGASRRALTMDELKLVHRLMAEDLSGRLPSGVDFDTRTAQTRCLLGQPVKLSSAPGAIPGVLRLCSSSRLISEAMGRAGVSNARSRQAALESGLDDLAGKVRLALDKVSLIAANLPALKD